MTTQHLTTGRAALIVAALMIGAPAVQAKSIPGQPDPARGAELAGKLCSNCHVAEAKPSQTINPDVPTFREIANREGRTREWIAGKIILPVHPMPNLNLSRKDIDDLVAYILSLKTAN